MVSEKHELPYYAVIFTSIKSEKAEGYDELAKELNDLVQKQEGFLGYESARNELGITVSYWKDLESIKKWKENETHRIARKKGREEWYKSFKIRIAKVEKEYGN